MARGTMQTLGPGRTGPASPTLRDFHTAVNVRTSTGDEERNHDDDEASARPECRADPGLAYRRHRPRHRAGRLLRRRRLHHGAHGVAVAHHDGLVDGHFRATSPHPDGEQVHHPDPREPVRERVLVPVTTSTPTPPSETRTRPTPTNTPPTATVTATVVPQPTPTAPFSAAPSPSTTTQQPTAGAEAQTSGAPSWLWWLLGALAVGAIIAVPLLSRRRRQAWEAELAAAEDEVIWLARDLVPQLRLASSPIRSAGAGPSALTGSPLPRIG